MTITYVTVDASEFGTLVFSLKH